MPCEPGAGGRARTTPKNRETTETHATIVLAFVRHAPDDVSARPRCVELLRSERHTSQQGRARTRVKRECRDSAGIGLSLAHERTVQSDLRAAPACAQLPQKQRAEPSPQGRPFWRFLIHSFTPPTGAFAPRVPTVPGAPRTQIRLFLCPKGTL